MTKTHDTFEHRKRIIGGYSSMIKTQISSGSDPYLMTIMFNHINGNERTRLDHMKDEIKRMYSILTNRSHRNPTSPSAKNRLPVLIACPDVPVAKHSKKSIADIVTNDGHHFHGLLLVPPLCRIRDSVVEHFESKQSLYTNNRLNRIDVRPIKHDDVDRVTDYVFKAIKNRRISDDDGGAILILNGNLLK
jgi:hypothetical protein